MKIAVVGGGFANKGAEAMLLTVQAELCRRNPAAELIMWGCCPWEVALADTAGFRSIPLPTFIHHGSKALWLLEQCIRAPWHLFPAMRSGNIRCLYARAIGEAVTRTLGSFDAVIDISGYAYGDTWGPQGIHLVAPLLRRAQAMGLKVAFMPQAWGPFETTDTICAMQELLNISGQLVYARDNVSSRCLSSLSGRKGWTAIVRPDIVFALKGRDKTVGRRLLEDMGCTGQRPILGITPNMRMYERTSGTGPSNIYVMCIVDLVRMMISRYDVDVLLLANEMADESAVKDDRYLCNIVAMKIAQPDRCFQVLGNMDAVSLKSLIGICDLLVGSRFHSLVFALSSGIPCVALGWSHKYDELMGDFDLCDYVWDMKSKSVAELCDKTSMAWENRRALGMHVEERLSRLREDIQMTFDELAAYLS